MKLDSYEAINHAFAYHRPFGSQEERYNEVRAAAKLFALVIQDLCPPSEERTLALRDLQRCVMMANASIALNEKLPDDVI